jgi:DNA repair protein RecO (recombination protein O)
MPVERTAGLVIGSFPLGESDRVVGFFTRRFGRVRGVARAARRLRSRFGGALELFTLGDLVFFDGGRSDLVQVDHFDVRRPFEAVRSDLDRLGHAAWMTECVRQLTAERDPHPELFTLLVRALASVEAGAPASRAAVVFGVRAVDLLGHRLRTDRCVSCGGGAVRRAARVAVDVGAGGTVCAPCARALGGVVEIGGSAVAALGRLRAGAWDRAVAGSLGAVEAELRAVLDAQVAALGGRASRATRFLREVSRTLLPAGVAGGQRPAPPRE